MAYSTSIFYNPIASTDSVKPLEWTLAQSYLSIDPENFICEGNLHELLPNNSSEFMHYVLTKEMLIKSRILPGNNTDSDSLESFNNYFTKIDFSMLTFSRLNGFYGFRLTAGPISRMFITESEKDLETWIESLKEMCVLNDFDKNYTVEGVLGHGGSAIVKLVKHNGSGKKYAVKILSKEWLFSHSQGIVFFY